MSLVAAVDCGTNSVRLLVARVDGPASAWVERDAVVTRLGAGVDASGRLGEAAIVRTVAVVADFVARARVAGARAVRVLATSAARDAANRERFLAAVSTATGITPEILTGDAEAALSFAGAVAGVDPPRPAIVLDIGGGSTEFVLGDERVQAATSRQIGSVRLTEQALPGDPPDDTAITAARRAIDRELDAVAQAIDVASAAGLVGVAGTVTTLAALHRGLATYDARAIHATTMTREDVSGLVERLRGLPAAQIAGFGPVAPGREDVLLAGALLLERTLERGGFHAVIVSETDLLDAACRQAAG